MLISISKGPQPTRRTLKRPSVSRALRTVTRGGLNVQGCRSKVTPRKSVLACTLARVASWLLQVAFPRGSPAKDRTKDSAGEVQRCMSVWSWRLILDGVPLCLYASKSSGDGSFVWVRRTPNPNKWVGIHVKSGKGPHWPAAGAPPEAKKILA
eukprot:985352-Prymnesium_polylepis.1